MKHLKLLFPFLFLTAFMNAQEISSGSWCGAEPSPEAIAMMNSLQPQVNEYTARFLENRGRLPVATVPIRPHIIRRNDGTGGYTQAEFDAALEIVNSYYQNANLQFVQCGPANYIDSDKFYDFDYSEQNDLLRSPEGEYNSGVIDLYIPGGGLTANGGSLCGYALFPWQTPASFFVVRRSCMDRGNTFAHELGHYLGLYHTHGKNNCGLSDELANGSNCEEAGDNVCDTPADPNLSGLNCQFLLVSQGCNYIGTYTDANGQPYNPEVSNVMSYAPPGCRTTFTAGQYARASFYYNEYRAATLACEGVENSSCPNPTNLSVTGSGQSSLDLGWETVPGAVAYQARYRTEGGSWIERAWSPSTFLMLNNLSPCTIYEFQVRADCGGDEFSTYSPVLRAVTQGCGASLEASPEFIEVSSDAGFATVTVSTPLEWTTSEVFSWIGITGGSGIGPGSFRVNYTENPSANARASFLTVNAGDLSRIVSITQGGQPPYLTVSPAVLNLGPEAGFANFSISSNASWRVSDDAEWLRSSPENSSNNRSVQLNFDANPSTFSRQAIVTVSSNGVPDQVINITQEGIEPFLEVSPVLSEVGPGAGMASLTVSSNANWVASTETDWIELSQSQGNGNGELAASYTANESTSSRSGIITLAAEGISITVEILQEGAAEVLEATPTALEAGPDAGSTTFEISSNISWSLSKDAEWLSLSPAAGSNNATVTVDYQANTSTESREANIQLAGEGGLIQSLALLQAGVAESISVNPAGQEVDAPAGCLSFDITANTAWSASYSAPWISSVTPAAGDGNATVEVCYETNTTENARSASLTFGNGSASAQATLQQAGNPTAGAPWNIALTGSNHVVIIPDALASDIEGEALSTEDWVGFFFDDNGTEACAGAGQWSPSANRSFPVFGDDAQTAVKEGFVPGETFKVKVWRTATGEEVEVAATFAPPAGIITSTDTYQADGISQLESLESISKELPWEITPTGSNHTIIVPSSLQSDIDGVPLAEEDWIGFFFDDNGTAVCAGAGKWSTSGNQSFAVFGDDAQTLQKDGFASGEAFQVRVWDASAGQEQVVEARFSPPDLIISQEGNYANDGISQLASLTNNQSSLTLSLKEGWNMVSSYIRPESPAMANLFAEAANSIIIIKDGAGNSFIPQLAIDDIGDWNITEGYKVKVNQDTEVEFRGSKAYPSSTPIPIESGWQIIAYLRDSPSPAITEMAGIGEELILLKDNFGASYIPLLGINNIGNLQPMQGYQLKAAGATTLIYTDNGEGLTPPFSLSGRNLAYYELNGLNTGNNATLVVPAEVAEGWLSPGDELGVFNQAGLLCGGATYQGENLALALWGDDPGTATVEGLQGGEPFTIKHWDAAGARERIVRIQLREGETAYATDGLFVASGLEVASSLHNTSGKEVFQVECFPNPAGDFLRVQTFAPAAGAFSLSVFSSSGKLVYRQQDKQLQPGWQQLELRLEQLPAGLYSLQARLGEEIVQQRFIKH